MVQGSCDGPDVLADIVEIKHILLPSEDKRFKDIFVVFELMETDLHQVGSTADCMPGKCSPRADVDVLCVTNERPTHPPKKTNC